MKNKNFGRNFLLLNVFSIILIFITIAVFYFVFISMKNQSVQKDFRDDFDRILTHINYLFHSEKDKFELIVSSPLTISQSPLTHFKDFYSVSPDGKVLEVYKRSSQFVYYNDFDISLGELYRDLIRFKDNMVYYYGPFYSILTKERTIALVYKNSSRTYIAHLNLSTIPEFREYFLEGYQGSLILTSKDGMILLDPTHSFPYKNITMEEGNLTIDSKSYYHILNYIPVLNLYAHLIMRTDSYQSPGDKFPLIFMVFFIVIIILITLRTILGYFLEVRPVNLLRNDVLQMDLKNFLRHPDPYYEEFSQIRKSISELLKRIQMEIQIEKKIKDYYDNIINSFPNLIITTDLEEGVVMINDTAVDFFGKTNDLEKKMNLSEIITFSPEEQSVYERYRTSSANSATIIGKRIMKEKSVYIFNIYIYRLMSEEELVGFAFILIDVTQQSLMEEQLLQTQK